MAIKTFPHAVIYNGVFYPANTPVDMKESEPVKPTEKKAVEKDDKRAGRKA